MIGLLDIVGVFVCARTEVCTGKIISTFLEFTCWRIFWCTI